jgi:hypothetical protein
VAGAGLAAYLLSVLLSHPVAAPLARVPQRQLAPALDLQPLQATPALPADEQAPPLQPTAATAAQPTAPAPQRRASAKEKRPVQPATTLLEEVRALDAIRSALQAGELAGAARGLKRYDQRFPHGELAREKSLLALDLLLAAGQREQAQVRARELLAQPGMERYAARLRAVAEVHSPGARDSRPDGSDSGSAHIRPRR